MNMFISMMVVNPQLLVAGEKKDKKEDDIDMSDGKWRKTENCDDRYLN